MADWTKDLASKITAQIASEEQKESAATVRGKTVDHYYAIVRGLISDAIQRINEQMKKEVLRINAGGGPPGEHRHFSIDSPGRNSMVVVNVSDIAITAWPTSGEYGSMGASASKFKLELGLQTDASGIRAFQTSGNVGFDEDGVAKKVVEFAVERLITKRGERQ